MTKTVVALTIININDNINHNGNGTFVTLRGKRQETRECKFLFIVKFVECMS